MPEVNIHPNDLGQVHDEYYEALEENIKQLPPEQRKEVINITTVANQLGLDFQFRSFSAFFNNESALENMTRKDESRLGMLQAYLERLHGLIDGKTRFAEKQRNDIQTLINKVSEAKQRAASI